MEDPSLSPRDRGLAWSQHFRGYQGDVPTTGPPPAAAPPVPFHTPPPWSGLGFWGSCQEAYAHNATEARRLKATQGFRFQGQELPVFGP